MDRAISKYYETQSVKRIYEQLIKYLQTERLTFDAKLVDYETALKLKRKEYSELFMISKDANQAKDIAKVLMHLFRTNLLKSKFRLVKSENSEKKN